MKGLISPASTPRRAAVAVVALALLALVSMGCARERMVSTTPAGPDLSPKLTPFLYFEDGNVAFVGVDGRAAQYVKKGDIFPLAIGLANRGMTPISLGRESFVLETSDGERFPLASVEEYNRGYSRTSSDLRLLDTGLEAMNMRFATYSYVERQLFPMKGSRGTGIDNFELGRNFWTMFYVYFPIPEEGIHDKEFALLVDIKEHEDPLVVRFKVK
jgi:hypothetical protein